MICRYLEPLAHFRVSFLVLFGNQVRPNMSRNKQFADPERITYFQAKLHICENFMHHVWTILRLINTEIRTNQELYRQNMKTAKK